jgi:hypothetical protein
MFLRFLHPIRKRSLWFLLLVGALLATFPQVRLITAHSCDTPLCPRPLMPFSEEQFNHKDTENTKGNHTPLCPLCLCGSINYPGECGSPLSPAPRLPAPASRPLTADLLTTLPPFGFETNTGRITHPQVFAYARQLGATWIRLNTVSWLSIQPDEERIYHWDALETFEQELLAARQAGLIPIVVVDDNPAWATKPYWNPATGSYEHARCGAIEEAHFANYAAFLRELVARYSPPPYEVRYWELGNEVDVDPRLLSEELQRFFGCWGDIDDPYYGGRHYGAMLQAVVPAIRESNPDAQVLIGGLALDRPDTQDPAFGKPERFFEGILLSGAGDFFDIVGFHVYVWYEGVAATSAGDDARTRARMHRLTAEEARRPALTSPQHTGDVQMDPDRQNEQWAAWGGATVGKVRFLRETMQRYGIEDERPLFLNETGLVASPPHESPFFEAQADHLVRQLARAMSVGVQSYVWYTLHESGWLSAGLLDRSYTPRPPYTAYQHFIRQVRGSDLRPAAIASYGDAIEAYRFSHTDGYVDILWSTRPASQPVTITLPLLNLQQATSRSGAPLPPDVQGADAHLSVTSSPIFIRSGYSPPHIEAINPSEGHTDSSTPVYISGSGFMMGASATLCNRPLERATVVDSGHIRAVVPAGLPSGTCNLALSNPDGQMNTLPLAWTTLSSGPPRIEKTLPEGGATGNPDPYGPYGPSIVSHSFNIYGLNFTQGITATLGTLPLTPTRISGTHLQAHIPPVTLPPGTYPLTLTTSEGMHATRSDSYTFYTPANDDLTGSPLELSLDPPTLRAHEPVQVQLPVHRYGGRETIYSVSVDFAVRCVYNDEQEEGDNPVILERATIPLLPPASTRNATTDWTPPAAGTCTLTATIDPEQAIAETIEHNNQISRTLVVLPPRLDTTPPTIRDFAIVSRDNGLATTTTQPTVTLEIAISELWETMNLNDSVLLLVVEYGYTLEPDGESVEWWLPVQHSGWLTHTRATTYTWRLAPTAGSKHIQVWAADRPGNISPRPAHASITYAPPASEPLEPPVGSTPRATLALPPTPAFPSHSLYLPILWR